MKDQTLTSASHSIESNKVNKTQPDVPGHSNNISNPSSHDNVAYSNQQQHAPIVQWSSYTPQNATQQLMAVSFPNQPPSPGVVNQWQQFLQQVQVFAQSTPPFWPPPQLPGGGNQAHGGANFPPVFQTWQAHQTPIPNVAYHVGYPFPGFPGPCNPSSMLGQMQQLQHSHNAYIAGAPGFSSASPTMPSCSTSGEPSSPTKPTTKLSRKHQQLWDAQSVENVQLRSMVDKLQAEVSDYKDRLMKLEEEVSSLKRDYKDHRMKLEEEVSSLKKQKVEIPKTGVIATIPVVEIPKTGVIATIPVGSGQPPKRGRGRPPKRSLSSLEQSHEPHPVAQARKPAAINQFQLERKSPIFEKVILKKAESREIPTRMSHQENNGKILNGASSATRMMQPENNGKILNGPSNSVMPPHQRQVNQQYQGIKMSGSGAVFSFASGVKINFERDKDKDMKMVYSEQSQPNKVSNNGTGVSTKYIGYTGNGNHGLTSSNGSARALLDAAHQSVLHDASLIKHGEKIPLESNSANEEYASEELEDENEEEMGDDTSYSAEEISGERDGLVAP
ncbi:hypothetical protein RIF29_36918 [Crotalaria pallida]|uniref:Uncharacterized protein n=1 Tax=Crotalaria pallida TaxID=3830 RepID=A0AAN9HUW5_CROPI